MKLANNPNIQIRKNNWAGWGGGGGVCGLGGSGGGVVVSDLFDKESIFFWGGGYFSINCFFWVGGRGG